MKNKKQTRRQTTHSLAKRLWTAGTTSLASIWKTIDNFWIPSADLSGVLYWGSLATTGFEGRRKFWYQRFPFLTPCKANNSTHALTEAMLWGWRDPPATRCNDFNLDARTCRRISLQFFFKTTNEIRLPVNPIIIISSSCSSSSSSLIIPLAFKKKLWVSQKSHESLWKVLPRCAWILQQSSNCF